MHSQENAFNENSCVCFQKKIVIIKKRTKQNSIPLRVFLKVIVSVEAQTMLICHIFFGVNPSKCQKKP